MKGSKGLYATSMAEDRLKGLKVNDCTLLKCSSASTKVHVRA